METHALGDRMREIPIDEASDRLGELADSVETGCEIVVLQREGGKAVALIAEDELSILMEEVHLLRSAQNSRQLFEALEHEEGKRLSPAEFEAWLTAQRTQLARGA